MMDANENRCHEFTATELVGGSTPTPGRLVATATGLSFWGGVDPRTSAVVDHTHPLFGKELQGAVLAVPNGRGSCTGSQVVLELLLNGVAPRALLLRRPDAILALGVFVAEEMFGVSIPIVDLGPAQFDALLTLRGAGAVAHAAVHGRTVLAGPSEVHVRCALDGVLGSPACRPPSDAERVVADSALSLTDEEFAILRGDDAKAVAMRILMRAAAVDGAPSLLPIAQAHIDGCTYIGPGGLRFARRLAELGGRVAVPTTLNSTSVDRRRWEALGVSAALGEPAQALGDAYVAMGCSDRSFTCAPYLLESRPTLGEPIAWGESNAVVYANSVLGSRTEKVADYLDICCAITGLAPRSGVHLDCNRLGKVVLDVQTLADEVLPGMGQEEKNGEDAFYPLLGYLCGMKSEADIPVIVGLEKRTDVTTDHLKAFSAAFGSTAAVPMFHMVGHTPEAPDLVTALGNVAPLNTTVLRREDFEEAWSCLDSGGRPEQEHAVQLVAVGNPHLSLTECQRLAELCEADGGRVAPGVRMIATVGREVHARAAASGHVARLRAFGAELISDTCWCMLTYAPVVPPTCDALLTNSAKYAHYAPGLVGKRVHFRGLAGCVAAARSGRAPPAPGWARRGAKAAGAALRKLR